MRYAQNVIEFLTLVKRGKNFLLRGQPKHNEPLLPAVARSWTKGLNPLLSVERTMLHDWKRRALPFLGFRPNSDWEWLMLGQHYGMPTRLLDWTTNPLVALYFACASGEDTDGAVFTIPSNSNIEELDFAPQPDPFSIAKPVYLAPPHITPRLAAQDSFFTASPNPLKSLNAACSMKVVIRRKHKRALLDELYRYGIRPASLFPDLIGLALDIAYSTREMKEGYIRLFQTDVPSRPVT